MAGKSYYCDYCCCYMKNDINVRKKHNEGLSHTIAKTNYMRRYEDPSKVYALESAKVPCSRYHIKGSCKFELFCKFSHYTAKQLEQLKHLARSKSKQKRKRKHVMSWQQQLPWYKSALNTGKLPQKSFLPPSLQMIDFQRLNATHFETQWGV